jgi:hypothetical protein
MRIFFVEENRRTRVSTEWSGSAVNTLPRIWKVPGSNLGLETGYPQVFRAFPHSLQTHAGIYLKLGHDSLLPHRFPFIIHPVTFHSTLHSLSYWERADK